MAIKANFSEAVEMVVGPIGRVLSRIGLTPNMLTTMGMVLTGVAAWLVVSGRLVTAALVLALGGLADTFDGAVARARGTSSPFGGFYDSVSDRVSDGVILSALMWVTRDDGLLFGVTAVALVTALGTSYVRSRAEAIGVDCSIGMVERAERAILVLVALLVEPLFVPVLWILAAGGLATMLQRVLHVRAQLVTRPVVFAGGRPTHHRDDELDGSGSGTAPAGSDARGAG